MFPALLDTINTVLGLVLDGAKLPPNTTPDTLASTLATAVSLFTGEDPDAKDRNADRKIGPKEPEGASIFQMSASLGGGQQIRDLPKVIAYLNKLLKAAEIMETLPPKTTAQELGNRLTELVMGILQSRTASAPVAQMGGRLTPAITRRAKILDHYQTFRRMNAYRADTALRMAVKIVDKRR